jgi:hypothetical protein
MFNTNAELQQKLTSVVLALHTTALLSLRSL